MSNCHPKSEVPLIMIDKHPYVSDVALAAVIEMRPAEVRLRLLSCRVALEGPRSAYRIVLGPVYRVDGGKMRDKVIHLTMVQAMAFLGGSGLPQALRDQAMCDVRAAFRDYYAETKGTCRSNTPKPLNRRGVRTHAVEYGLPTF